MKKDKLPLVTAASSFDAVVLCDGDYPSHAVALSILQHAKYLVCCDGAGMHYILHGGTPGIWHAAVSTAPQHARDNLRRTEPQHRNWKPQ